MEKTVHRDSGGGSSPELPRVTGGDGGFSPTLQSSVKEARIQTYQAGAHSLSNQVGDWWSCPITAQFEQVLKRETHQDLEFAIAFFLSG